MAPLPKVLLVGGPDVDARLPLMRHLKIDFNIGAVGSSPAPCSEFRAEGFTYRVYHLNRQVNPLSDLWSLTQLASIFRNEQPQIVHAFDTKPGIWGCLAAKLAGVPVIIGTVTGYGGSLYGSRSRKTQAVWRIYQRMQKSASRVSDLTIFQNNEDARQCIESGIVADGKSRVVLGSGVSTDLFAPSRISAKKQAQLRNELGIQPKEIVVTLISRVIRSKGVLEFIAAAQAVRSDHPHVRFLLIGSEDDVSPDRLSEGEQADLKQRVIWPGSRQDIPAILSISDMFVLPTTYREGIPRVLLEAASMGLPLIATDVPGCNEVVEDGINGFLVPTHDASAVTRAILHLIAHPELCQRFGCRSRQRAVTRFDLSIIAAETARIYGQALATKRLTMDVQSIN